MELPVWRGRNIGDWETQLTHLIMWNLSRCLSSLNLNFLICYWSYPGESFWGCKMMYLGGQCGTGLELSSRADCPGSNPDSAPFELCDFGQVPWVSVPYWHKSTHYVLVPPPQEWNLLLSSPWSHSIQRLGRTWIWTWRFILLKPSGLEEAFVP